MELNNAHRERKLVPQRFITFGIASLVVHVLIFLFFYIWVGRLPDAIIIAAGPGEGGNGGGGAIEVGVTDAAELGFARKQIVSHLEGNKKDTFNNERLKHVADPEEVEEVIPRKKDRPDDEAKKTNLPVPTKEERRWSQKIQRASSDEATANVNSSYGSQKPTIQGGIGIGKADNSGLGTGLPGGSEYGRRIQNILSRNFTPPNIPVNGVSNVVIYVKISRDGRITSVMGGRVPRTFFKQSSANEQLNYAAERAIIAAASQGLPPFPANFLIGTQEAVAEVWFQYP